MLSISARQAILINLLAVLGILDEAVSWLKQQNIEYEPAGAVKFKIENLIFCSDIFQEDSAFID